MGAGGQARTPSLCGVPPGCQSPLGEGAGSWVAEGVSGVEQVSLGSPGWLRGRVAPAVLGGGESAQAWDTEFDAPGEAESRER